jgi:hypothetical protein
VRALLSMEAGTSTEWEASFACWSWWRAGNMAPITVLSAGGPPGEPMPGADEIFVHPRYNGADGGEYAPYNRLYGLVDWLNSPRGENTPADETLLLIDPDTAVLDVVPDHAPPFNAAAVAWYVNHPEQYDPYVRRLTAHPECFTHVGIGVPAWLRRDELAFLLPGWIAQTRALRAAGLPTFAWVAEMIAFWLALADTCAEVTLVDEACGPHLVHYVYGTCGLAFTKYQYRAWDPILPPSPDASPLAVALTGLLNEYAALRRQSLRIA